MIKSLYKTSSNNIKDLYKNLYENELKKKFKNTEKEEKEADEISALEAKTSIVEAAAVAKEKVQKIIDDDKSFDSFTKEEDILKKETEEKLTAKANKAVLKQKENEIDKYISFFMNDKNSDEAKAILKEIDAIKAESTNIRNYTASVAAINFGTNSLRTRINDAKEDIENYNRREKEKEKQENEKSIIDNRNKEVKTNTNNDWIDNLFKQNVFKTDIKEVAVEK